MKNNNKKIKKKDTAKKTMKDAYKLSRSSIMRADKPRPIFSELRKIKDIELETIDDNSFYS